MLNFRTSLSSDEQDRVRAPRAVAKALWRVGDLEPAEILFDHVIKEDIT
jgi:hypothetical protein